MNRNAWTVFISSLALSVSFSGVLRAEDAPKPDAPKADAPKADDGGKNKDARNRNRWQGQGGQPGGQGGPGGPGGPGGFGLGGLAGGNGGGNMLTNVASRMLGVDVQDPKAGPKLDTLPLGVDKRFVLNVPVGGVDNPGGTGTGWKMEAIFKMTDEQTKSVDALRDEYKDEQKKLDVEILAQQKAIAEKVVALRAKYEKRANDVLTGDDKDKKEKMDAMMRESSTKNANMVADMLPLYDMNDFNQGMAMVRALRDKMSKNNQEADTKFLELVPAESKQKIEEVLKEQNAAKDQMGRWMAGNRGRGGKGPDDNAVKPPPPPAAPGNF